MREAAEGFPDLVGRRERHDGERPMVPPQRPTSYYGHPVIKRPVWKPEIAAYFFTGGFAGASMLLAAAARRRGEDRVARRALFTAFAAVNVSPLLLIRDLGVPSRFLNMLRVVKVTSPMSIGSWLLTGAGAATAAATGCELLGVLPRLRTATETAAAALGAPLSTYTAALIADTAVPVWHEAALELPLVFASTSVATAGAASLLLNPPAENAMARSLAIGGAIASAAGTTVMERRLGELAEPYHSESSGAVAKALLATGAATLALGGRKRLFASVGGAAILTGGFLERWSIFKAGEASATDPKYTVGPQRQRLDRREGRVSQRAFTTPGGEPGVGGARR
jgi:formate-dependent nitrite reductase membrane component NrfD